MVLFPDIQADLSLADHMVQKASHLSAKIGLGSVRRGDTQKVLREAWGEAGGKLFESGWIWLHLAPSKKP
jgi:hypothetical protein